MKVSRQEYWSECCSPGPRQWERGVLTTGPPGYSPRFYPLFLLFSSPIMSNWSNSFHFSAHLGLGTIGPGIDKFFFLFCKLTGLLFFFFFSYKELVSSAIVSEVKSLSRVRLLVTPWTAAHQAPPSMGFSRQEYWCGVPLPSLPL